MNQFKLIVDGESIRKHNIEVLKDTIFNLNKKEGDFVILEPKHPINDSIYLQVVFEDGIYLTEIRFVFGSDSNYKHYSYVVNDKETIFKIFADYYLEEKTPNIQDWKDNSSTFTDGIEDEMVKLYKKSGKDILYFEVWLNDDNISLTTHKGALGDMGETEDIIYDEEDDLPVKVGMAKIVSDLRQLGYYDNVSLTEMIIQYTYNDNENMSVLVNKRQHIESLLNECLGWTGNGHCDGGDVGSGSMNLFCYVVDKDIAARTILEMLVEEGYLDGVSIAYADERTEEYELIYPEKGYFEL